MKNLTVLVTAAAIAALSSTSAWAQDPSEAPTVLVRFGDLDTTSTVGAAALYTRIANAAQLVCPDLLRRVALSLVAPHTECVRAAIANAIAKVDLPAVTAYARARGVPPPATVVVADK